MALPTSTPESSGLQFLGSFVVPGRTLSKANEKTAGRWLSTKMRDWEDLVAWLAKSKLKPKVPATSGWVVIQMYCKNHSHIDLSNSPKSIVDGLVKGGIFKHDREVALTVPFAVYGCKDESTEISIWV